jgi:hypothetical protein
MSFTEVIEMPIDYIMTFRYLIFTQQKEKQDENAAKALEDELEDIM